MKVKVLLYESESKSHAFFFITGVITNTGTCIIHQKEAGPMWITSLLLNIGTVSFNSNVSPSNESMYPCFIKLCGLFFHSLITGIIFAF